jgi:hypothetical protein
MSKEDERRIWPGGLTTEEVMAEVAKGYYRAKRRMEFEADKRKAREQARNQKVVDFPRMLSQEELMRRQAVIDEHWERMLFEKQLRQEEALKRSFHKAPGDPDWSA